MLLTYLLSSFQLRSGKVNKKNKINKRYQPAIYNLNHDIVEMKRCLSDHSLCWSWNSNEIESRKDEPPWQGQIVHNPQGYLLLAIFFSKSFYFTAPTLSIYLLLFFFFSFLYQVNVSIGITYWIIHFSFTLWSFLFPSGVRRVLFFFLFWFSAFVLINPNVEIDSIVLISWNSLNMHLNKRLSLLLLCFFFIIISMLITVWKIPFR